MQWITIPLTVPDKPYLTLEEVCTWVGYSDKIVTHWISNGKFPLPRRLNGSKERWSSRSVAVWLAWQEYDPQAVPLPKSAEKKPGKSPE